MKTAARVATPREHITYNLFWLGQNLLWGFVSNYLASYLNMGLGIDSLAAAAILVGPRIWDAVNDTLFGYIVDRHRFKNGQQFMPWIRIGTFGIGIVGIVMFAIPRGLPQTSKIIWFVITYVLFDALYTFLDAPCFAMSTVMTDDMQERTAFISGNKLFAMLGGVGATVLVGVFTEHLGWTWAAVIFCAVGNLLMVPYLFAGKERRHMSEQEREEKFTFSQMFRYLKTNRYLFVCLGVFFIFGMSAFEQPMALYVAKICFGGESKQMAIAACAAVPVILVSALLPRLTRRFDKFHILIAGLSFSAVVSVIAIFIGCRSFVLSAALIALKCVGLACWQIIVYMLVADTTEYGTYKSGVRATGITFSLQTFISKMNSALANSFMLVCISLTGYNEQVSEQTAEVVTKVWRVFLFVPALGYGIGILALLCFFKLRSADVQLMAKFNNGEISYAEADAALSARFGHPHQP